MSEDIQLGPARKVKLGAGRQEIETGLGQRLAIFPFKPLIECISQSMQVEDVGGGVIELLLGQFLAAPIGALLLLGQIDPQQFGA